MMKNITSLFFFYCRFHNVVLTNYFYYNHNLRKDWDMENNIRDILMEKQEELWEIKRKLRTEFRASTIVIAGLVQQKKSCRTNA